MLFVFEGPSYRSFGFRIGFKFENILLEKSAMKCGRFLLNGED